MNWEMNFIRIVLAYSMTLTVLLSYGQEGLDPIRVFNSSCSEICDGSAEFMTYRTIPGRYFYWMSEVDDKYHSMNDAILDELCPGKYRIRQVDVVQQELDIAVLSDTTKADFDGISSCTFTSMSKREMSLFIKLNKEINHLNYYLKADYSTDGGISWNSSQQFHQKVIKDAAGHQFVYYLMNFPRKSQEKKEVIVKIYQRKTERLSGQPNFKVERAFLESKEFEEYAFEIGINENIRIQSTVSNELEGNDGYIALELKGGLAPYLCSWEDGSTGEKRKDLGAGTYSVLVTDMKNCTEEAKFIVLPPDGSETSGVFTLTKKLDSQIFQLGIKALYRQPLDLVLSSEDHTEVKRFQINPLYEDLNMDLDLSFLSSGNYRATLSTSGFSKNISFHID